MLRVLTVAALVLAGLPAAALGFAWEDVLAKARALSQEAFYGGEPNVPEWLTKITYDQWRDIRFRPEFATWRGTDTPVQVQYFHPGLFYNRSVTINLIEDLESKPAVFAPTQYDYGRNEFASRVPQNLGHAGFRLHAPIKSPDYFDEVIVFLGASYFRAVGRDQGFGLSARGLVIDTAEPWGEEFPFFRELWIERPRPGSDTITVFALLDSPSVTGAYGFVIRPGVQTVTDVHAVLFPRRDIRKLGIAPLTSMFFHGENTVRKFDDFRPEAHDSDGLLIHFQSGDWLWRPLDNPEELVITRFEADDPLGFGLIQRDRSFSSYEDLETRAERRPSAWVQRIGAWGRGRLELVEIPTRSDTNDNVVAYWVPVDPVKKGKSIELTYRIFWYGDDAALPPLGRAVATRRDGGERGDAERFVVDFAGPALQEVPAEEIVHGMIAVLPENAAELLGQHVVKNPVTGGWRLSFRIRPRSSTPLDLRARLEWRGEPLTEIWAYPVRPQ